MVIRRCLPFLGFRAALRCRLLPFSSPPLPSPRFHTLDDPFDPHSHAVTEAEASVLLDHSDLLHLDDPNISIAPPDPPPPDPPDRPVTDRLLSPVEKLRGVFLQKLRGRAAVESALSATGVDLTPEVFAGVVNRGNLGGAAMVSFFDWAIKQRNLPRCVDTYNAIVKALGRRKFFDFMVEMLFRMEKDGVKPDGRTVAIALDCYVAARRVRKALETFERLEEFGASRDGESLGALLHSLCRWSHAKLAKSYMNKMRGKIPFDAVAYNEIIGGWVKLGRVDEAERALRAMVADGLTPDSQTYGHFIQGLGSAGRLDDALALFEELGERGCSPDIVTYGAVITNFLRAGDLDKGMEAYKKMVEENCVPDNDLYAKLICAFLKVRRVADALEVFDEMLSKGVHPSTGMITSFIEPLCSYGPPHAAMVIYRKSKKLGCVISLKAYKLLLMRLSRMGKCGMVLKVWQEMQESGYTSDVEVYEYIVDGLCNAGKLDSAVLVLEESLQNGFCIGGVVFSKLKKKLVGVNKMETAYKLLLKVREARRNANMRRTWRYKGWHF